MLWIPGDIFFQKNIIGGIPCSIGYIKKFKGILTQLNTFIIIGKTDDNIDQNYIKAFSKNCFHYALNNNKGWPRGLNSAVVSIAILQGRNIEQSAIDFCLKPSKKHWSAFEIPVLFDTSQGKYYKFKNYPIWGIIYFPYFSKIITDVIEKQNI